MLKLLRFFFPIGKGWLLFVLIAFAITVFFVSRNQIRSQGAPKPPVQNQTPLHR